MSNHILVIKHGALGDFILALPAFAAIRQYHRDDQITLLTTSPFKEFSARSPYFDRVWIDTKPSLFDICGWLKLRRRLRNSNFTRVYDLQTSGRSSFYHRLFWPNKTPEWSGIAKNCSHPDLTPVRSSVHSFELRVAQLQAAGVTVDLDPDLNWIEQDISALQLPERLLLIVPGSAPHRTEKRWPISLFSILAQDYAANGITPVILGTQSEAPLAQKIKQTCPSAVDLTGRTSLFAIAALARRAIAAVGNDTGPMHLIAAIGCSSVILFSAHSNPAHSSPRGRSLRTIQCDDLARLPVEDVKEALTTIMHN